jgi:hypothetical protein
VNDAEAIRLTRAHIESFFPKTCPMCHRRFAALADYLQEVSHLGSPVSYDAEADDWYPWQPIGTMSLANCSCGTTLAIDTAGMSLWTMWRLMRWARAETKARGVSVRELLAWVRSEIDAQVLREASSPSE